MRSTPASIVSRASELTIGCIVPSVLKCMSIPRILEEKAVLRRDGSGKPISTVTAMDAWSNSEHYAENEIFHYNYAELHKTWDHSGAYANLKYFHLTKKMYDQKEMLGQYGDFSGHWTPEQLALIHKKGLKE